MIGVYRTVIGFGAITSSVVTEFPMSSRDARFPPKLAPHHCWNPL